MRVGHVRQIGRLVAKTKEARVVIVRGKARNHLGWKARTSRGIGETERDIVETIARAVFISQVDFVGAQQVDADVVKAFGITLIVDAPARVLTAL